MELHLTLTEGSHLIKQIYQQLRAAILAGRLQAGDRLPPTRELAQQLCVSRNTVVEAYDLLMSEGLIKGVVGAGTFVSDNLNSDAFGYAQCLHSNGGNRQDQQNQSANSTIAVRSFWQTLNLLERPVARTDIAYDFGVGLSDRTRFPFSE